MFSCTMAASAACEIFKAHVACSPASSSIWSLYVLGLKKQNGVFTKYVRIQLESPSWDLCLFLDLETEYLLFPQEDTGSL